MEKTKETKVPQLSVHKVASIKYEDGKNFKNSVSAKAYTRAIAITEKIVDETIHFGEVKNQGKSGNELRNSGQLYNIIFFTGNKGTGKTSTMLSYAEFLKDYYRNFDKRDKDGYPIFQTVPYKLMFTGLECIDASSMDSKEDILGCVLSQMLKKWKEEEAQGTINRSRGIMQTGDYAYKKRSINMAFDEVHSNLKNLRSKNDVIEDEDDIFIETLQKLSLTWNLKESFRKLVELYLDIMKYPGAEGLEVKNHFLVIPIDDIDANIENAYKMIEQIRQYLMGTNIIVLLSADYRQLERICENHYSASFSGIRSREGMQEYIERLSREYLEKVVPADMQVVMPSGASWEFMSNSEMHIELEAKDEYEDGTIKQIVSHNLKQHFGLEISTSGRVISYLAPDTLRRLCTWVNQVHELAEKERDESGTIFWEWFWREIFSPITVRYLLENQAEVFERLEGLNFQEMYQVLGNEICKESDKSILETLAVNRYGTQKQRLFSDICCLYLLAQLNQLKGKSKAEFESHYWQYGVWGEWEKTMIKDCVKTILKPIPTSNSISISEISINYFMFATTNGGADLKLEKTDTRVQTSAYEKRIQMIIQNTKRIQNHEYILLFYQMYNEKNVLWKFDEKKENFEIINDASNSGKFALSMPFINLLNHARAIQKFEESFKTNMFRGLKGNEKTQIKELLDGIFVYDKMTDVEDNILIPLVNIEYLIDTGRKIESRMKNRRALEFSKENVTFLIKEFWNLIAESLEGYDAEFQTEYCKHFASFGLTKKINEDPEFMGQLYESIRASSVMEE